jgi:hypothetical protein
MITKFNEYITEKLSDKLSGFNEEKLKQQLINGKIDIFKYLDICKKYNIEITDDSLIKKEYEKYSLEDILYKSFTVNSKFAIDYVYNNNVSDKTIIDVINYVTLFYNDNMEVFIVYLISKYKDNETVRTKILSSLPLNKFIIFKLLIDNFNFTKNELNNLLINVCRYNSNENLKIEYLIENGADIHYQNENALSTAIFYDVYDNVECLIENGAIVTDDIFNNAISDKNLSMNIKKILINEYYEKQHN